MEAERVKNLKELDKLLPLIMELHEQAEAPYTVSGMIGWVVLSFHSPLFQMWAVYDEDRNPIGYCAACIEGRYFENECVIVDAYLKEPNRQITDYILDRLIGWAKMNNCRYVSFHTGIEKLGERVGVDKATHYFRKEI